MCYDISFRTKLEELIKYFPDLIPDPQLKVPWPELDHLAGTDSQVTIPIIFRDKDGILRLRIMEWSVLLNDVDVEPDKEIRNYNLNIMTEKILKPGSQWYGIRNNICLIQVHTFHS